MRVSSLLVIPTIFLCWDWRLMSPCSHQIMTHPHSPHACHPKAPINTLGTEAKWLQEAATKSTYKYLDLSQIMDTQKLQVWWWTIKVGPPYLPTNPFEDWTILNKQNKGITTIVLVQKRSCFCSNRNLEEKKRLGTFSYHISPAIFFVVVCFEDQQRIGETWWAIDQWVWYRNAPNVREKLVLKKCLKCSKFLRWLFLVLRHLYSRDSVFFFNIHHGSML